VKLPFPLNIRGRFDGGPRQSPIVNKIQRAFDGGSPSIPHLKRTPMGLLRGGGVGITIHLTVNTHSNILHCIKTPNFIK
jgi:hypothetical protein